MLLVTNKQTDPYFNLALEEYLMTHFEEDIFRLWQNCPSIIVGRNQNTMAEINYDYVTQHEIPVVRRMSGGGAVFHDLGNVNYTFIMSGSVERFNDYAYFAAPILEVLRQMGVAAQLSGRNDLVIDGMKFSGNAQYMSKGRMLHHGTLLLSSNIANISAALKVHPKKIEGKGIKSVVSRVTNINSHLKEPLEVPTFIETIAAHITATNPNATLYTLSEEDLAGVEELKRTKYGTWEWNFGSSPQYNFEKDTRFPSGLLHVHMQIVDGYIQHVRFYGDYFGRRDVGEIEEALLSKKHTRAEVTQVFDAFEISDYFSGITQGDLVDAMF